MDIKGMPAAAGIGRKGRRRMETEKLQMLEGVILLGMLGGYSWQDMKEHRISIKYLSIPTALGIALKIFGKSLTWKSLLLGIAVGGGVLLLALVTGELIGLGDGLLLTVTGIYLGGAGNFQLLMYGLFYAALVSLILMALHKWGKHWELPFIPFLFLGYLTILLGKLV